MQQEGQFAELTVTKKGVILLVGLRCTCSARGGWELDGLILGPADKGFASMQSPAQREAA
jgi:hypothetical protein